MNVLNAEKLKKQLNQKGSCTIDFQGIQPFFEREGIHLESQATSVNLIEAFHEIRKKSLFELDEAKAMIVCIKDNHTLTFDDYVHLQEALTHYGGKHSIIMFGSYTDLNLQEDEKVLSIYFFGFPRKKEIIEELLSKTMDEKERKYLQKERLKGLFMIK